MTTPPNGWLQAPATAVYKDDRRSRVWAIDTAEGRMVLKRFEHAPWRQALTAALGLHPAQRERRLNRRLAAAGVAVVPVVAWGREGRGLGCRVWLATPWAGRSLQAVLRAAELDDRTQRELAEAVGRLVGQLLAAGWCFRDLKTSNVLVDDAGGVRLIDVGSARRWRGRAQAIRMLAMLEHTARADGAPRAARLRALREVLRHVPSLGPRRRLAEAVWQQAKAYDRRARRTVQEAASLQ